MKYLNKRQRQSYKKRVVADSWKHGATKASRMYGIHRSTIYDWRKNIIPRNFQPNKMSVGSEHLRSTEINPIKK